MKIILLFCSLVLLFSGCGGLAVEESGEATREQPVPEIESFDQRRDEDFGLDVVTSTFDLPILAIHHVGEAPAGSSQSVRDWYISEQKFEEILQFLQAEEYTVLTIGEVLAYLDQGRLPQKSVVLTFDDGAVDFYTHALPLLKKYHMPVTMHLMTHVKSSNWLNEEQIRELHASGLVEFQSHTKYHEYLSRVSEEKVREELLGSKEKIEEMLGTSVHTIAYPFGLYNDTVQQIAKELGYRAGLTIQAGTKQSLETPFAWKRLIITEYTNIETLLK